MKNKGFSITECVFCLLLLSSVTIGVVTVTLNIQYQEQERLYKAELYTNYHTLFNIIELSSNPKNSLKEVYGTYFNEQSVDIFLITIPVSSKNKEALLYEVTINQQQEYQIVQIKILNLEPKYQELNHEVMSKRIIKK